MPLPDSDRLATGQILSPAGTQIALGGTMPQSIVLVPNSNQAVVSEILWGALKRPHSSGVR